MVIFLQLLQAPPMTKCLDLPLLTPDPNKHWVYCIELRTITCKRSQTTARLLVEVPDEHPLTTTVELPLTFGPELDGDDVDVTQRGLPE